MARLEDYSEVELKLTVVGDAADGLLGEVAALDRLGDDALGPVQRHRLRDLYWDTADGELREHGVTLRLRQMDDAMLFTAKDGTDARDGLFRRHELELPATFETWHAVREALAASGARLDERATRAGTPAEWLLGAGLVVTQDRATDRRAREVLRHDRAVAELALDRTTFRFRTLTVEYREIEVEQLGEQDVDLHGVGNALMSRFPGRLEPSTRGKYSLGLAIERQLRTAGLL